RSKACTLMTRLVAWAGNSLPLSFDHMLGLRMIGFLAPNCSFVARFEIRVRARSAAVLMSWADTSIRNEPCWDTPGAFAACCAWRSGGCGAGRDPGGGPDPSNLGEVCTGTQNV